MKTMLFGAFFTAKVTEPFSGKVYFEQPLRKGATKVVPVTQWQVDQWSASYEPCWPASMPSPAPPPSVPIRAHGWTNRSRAAARCSSRPKPSRS